MSIHWNTISVTKPAEIRPADAIVRQALSASGTLNGFLKLAIVADEPVLLIVNDPHRPTLTRPVLAVLAKHVAGGAARGDLPRSTPRFRAIVATGIHRFSVRQRDEFERETFVDCGLNVDDIVWHDATDTQSLSRVAGVRMHRAVAGSRFLLPIGSVEPHYFAGLTGPHKTVTIGCMSVEDIERNHAGAMNPSSEILRLRGNPVYDGIVSVVRGLEAAGKAICAIGEVVCDGSLLEAAVGDPLDVLDALSPTVHRVYVRNVPEPVDVLRLRVPLPLGRNLYQADKALKNNHLAVRNGGGIVLEAECGEGIGPDGFMALVRSSDDFATASETVNRRGYCLGDHKAVKLRYLMDPACRGVRVALVTPNLDDETMRGTGIRVFPEFQPALDWLTGVVVPRAYRGLTIEDAGMITVTPTCT